ncbi:MAG: uroporphyrinogen decarboxylase family protein [Candidatus Bathyarchaeia archaeon]
MCYERAISSIYLEDTDRIAQIEYIFHTDLIKKLAGFDPFSDPEKALAKTYEKLDTDLIFYTHQSVDPYAEIRKTDGKSFVNKENWSKLFPSIWRAQNRISSEEDVLNFEPSFGDSSLEQVFETFNETHDRYQKLYSSQLVPGGYYCTTFMWCVMYFGLEWTIRAAARDPKRFEKLLNRFAEISCRDFKAWSMCDIRAFISHDDICMTEGPIMNPDWLRKYVFPWYERLWKILKSKEIRVIFCSDGNVDKIIDDVAKAGADGFILEPSCNLQQAVDKYGYNKIIIGNIDLKTLTFGKREEVVQEVMRCIRTAGHCPGYFINVTGSIPDNVPIENLEVYFETCKKYGVYPIKI